MKVTITCKFSGDSYLARAKGQGITASCTSSAEYAVRKCAAKVRLWPHKDIINEDLYRDDLVISENNKQHEWTAEWPDPLGEYKAPPGLYSGWVNRWGRLTVEPYNQTTEIEAMTSPSVFKVLRGIQARSAQEAQAEAERRLLAGEYMLTMAGDQAQQTCDHKFVDSKECLKCGWRPDNAGKEVGK